jgi:hypothetical protein
MWIREVPRLAEASSFARSGTFMTQLTGSLNPWMNRILGPVLLGGTAWWFWATRARSATVFRPFTRDAGAATVGSLLYLLAGPIVHTHYFLQALPAGLILMRSARMGAPRPFARWAGAAAGCFLCGGHRYFVRWGWTTADNFSSLTYLGVWILLGMLLYDREADDGALHSLVTSASRSSGVRSETA